MKRTTLLSAFTASVLLAGWPCLAVTLSLSSAHDVSALLMGDTARIDVTLGELGGEDELVVLEASALFDGAILGTPTAVAAGAIVPGSLAQPPDFATFAAPGQADASFVTFHVSPIEHIINTGVFYSFDVTAAQPGVGSVVLDGLTLHAELVDPQNPFLPIIANVTAGGPLDFYVPMYADTDTDKDVDYYDYVAVRDGFGTPAGATWAQGDSDRDGDVDVYDYLALKVNFGWADPPGQGQIPPAQGTVPEPATLSLLALGGLALIRRRPAGP